VVTIVISAYMIIYCEQLYAVARRLRLLKPFHARQGEEEDEEGELGEHCIVVGMNGLGRSLVARLREHGERVLAVDPDPGKLGGLGQAETLTGNVEYETVRDRPLPGKAGDFSPDNRGYKPPSRLPLPQGRSPLCHPCL